MKQITAICERYGDQTHGAFEVILFIMYPNQKLRHLVDILYSIVIHSLRYATTLLGFNGIPNCVCVSESVE